MGHQNILTLVDYFETMNNCLSFEDASDQLRPKLSLTIPQYIS